MLALAAPWVQAWAWGVPFGYLSYAILLRAVVGTLVTALLSGILAIGCFAFTSPDIATSIGYQPAIVGGGTALAILWIRLRRSPLLKGAVLLVRRSREPDIRQDALSRLELLLMRSCKRAARRPRDHATLTLFALPLLSEVGRWDSLREALTAIDMSRLSEKESAVAHQALASVHIHLGDAQGARDALANLERPVEEPQVELWLVAIDALLFAVDGDAERALKLIGRKTPEGDAALQASHQIVRAHAWASQGDLQRARKALKGVLAVAGDAALRRALLPTGPASEIASTLLTESAD